MNAKTKRRRVSPARAHFMFETKSPTPATLGQPAKPAPKDEYDTELEALADALTFGEGAWIDKGKALYAIAFLLDWGSNIGNEEFPGHYCERRHSKTTTNDQAETLGAVCPTSAPNRTGSGRGTDEAPGSTQKLEGTMVDNAETKNLKIVAKSVGELLDVLTCEEWGISQRVQLPIVLVGLSEMLLAVANQAEELEVFQLDGREAHLVAKLAKDSGATDISDYIQGLIFVAAKNAGIKHISGSVQPPEWLNRVMPPPQRLIGDGARA